MWTRTGEGEGGTNGKSSTETYALPPIKQSEWEAATSHRELSLALWDDLGRWGGGDGREGGPRRRGQTCTLTSVVVKESMEKMTETGG